MLCPECGAEILPGDDVCNICLSSTSDIGLPKNKVSSYKRVMEKPIHQVSLKKPVIFGPDDSISSALEMMRKNHLGCVVVVDGKRLVGIFTERDALQKIAGSEMDLTKEKLKNYMTPNPEFLNPNHSIAIAINKMSVGGYRHLPVLEKGGLTGLISVRDILNHFWG